MDPPAIVEVVCLHDIGVGSVEVLGTTLRSQQFVATFVLGDFYGPLPHLKYLPIKRYFGANISRGSGTTLTKFNLVDPLYGSIWAQQRSPTIVKIFKSTPRRQT